MRENITKAKNKFIALCEILNSVTHGFGVGIGILFLIMLILKFGGIVSGGILTAFIVYASSFIFMFLSSTLYHAFTDERIKRFLRLIDHSSIFIFIAGSYTPIVMTILKAPWKWIFLSLIWAIAIGGLLFKIFTFGNYDRFKKISVILYVIMGWLSVILIYPIIELTSIPFMINLVLGGVFYTVGTYFYRKKEPFNHVIWHLFVLGGAVCHFIAIYNFLF